MNNDTLPHAAVSAAECIAHIEVLRAKSSIRRQIDRLVCGLGNDSGADAVAQYVSTLPQRWPQ